MSFSWSDPSWGEWVLGDATGTLRNVVDLLGGFVEFDSVTMCPPIPPAVLPLVKIVVGTTQQVDALRLEVAQGEFVATFDDDSGDEWFGALVAGLRLEVCVWEARS
jgi:hypothetical protein